MLSLSCAPSRGKVDAMDEGMGTCRSKQESRLKVGTSGDNDPVLIPEKAKIVRQ